MPTEIQSVALRALADIEGPLVGVKIAAAKVVRDRTDCELRDAIDAVTWALDHPGAGGLPIGSVVATAGTVYLKRVLDEPDLPWRHITDGMYCNYASDDEVTDLIQSGEAQVLRVGDGAK